MSDARPSFFQFALPGPLACLSIIVVTFLIRLPGLAQPIGIDQGIFATAGWGMSHGLRMYADLWDQKPPGIHLAYRAAFAVLGPTANAIFWLDFAAAALSCALLVALGRALSGPMLGYAAGAAFAAGSLPALRFSHGGFLERAVPETFIAMFVTFAALATVLALRGSPGKWLGIAGGAIGLAAIMKPTALVYGLALIVWVMWQQGWRALPTRALYGALAALLAPVAGVVLWLFLLGSLRDAWIAVVEYNRSYVSASGPVELFVQLARVTWRHVKTDPVWTAGFCGMAAAMAAGIRRKTLAPVPALCACWLSASAVAIAANGIRMFNSYFIPPVPALALAFAWLSIEWPGRRRWAWTTSVLALAAVVGWNRGGIDRAARATVADLRQWLGSGADRVRYLERFGGYQTGRGYSARANAELANHLATHSAPTDTVYIFGMAPSAYFLSQRLPAQRFLWAYPAVSDSVCSDRFTLDRLVHELAAAEPALLVLERNNRDSLMGWRIEQEFTAPGMRDLLAEHRLQAEIEDFLVFAR